MKTMYSYELNETQKQQLLDLFEDICMPINTDMLFKEYESFNCEVALDEELVVDVRIFDPFHQSTGSWNLHTDATGWSEWLCAVCEEDEQEQSNQLSKEDIQKLYGYEPYPEEDPRSSDLVKWIEDGEYNSCFYTEDGKRLFKIKENPNDDSSWIVVYLDEDGCYWRY